MAQISVLSAGAVKPGLLKVAAAFRDETRCEAALSFATAPAIAERIGRGEKFDIVVAPPPVLDALAGAGHIVAAERIAIGRIGVGALVRMGAPLPPMATISAFKQSLLAAESLVYNQASTGIYLAALFEHFGIAAELNAKSVRYPDFAGVLDHIRQAGDRAIGFGATAVIVENSARGVQFAGPLPDEIQNYTSYAAAPAGRGNRAALAFLHYLSAAPARSIFNSAGIG